MTPAAQLKQQQAALREGQRTWRGAEAARPDLARLRASDQLALAENQALGPLARLLLWASRKTLAPLVLSAIDHAEDSKLIEPAVADAISRAILIRLGLKEAAR